jgi:Ca2+-binding EF-hand superfamily protein
MHAFIDANGRTNVFLLLNYLLLEQGLSPCSIFNPWFICGLTSKERVSLIKEGQCFFIKYIYSKDITTKIPYEPLTSELNKIIEDINKCLGTCDMTRDDLMKLYSLIGSDTTEDFIKEFENFEKFNVDKETKHKIITNLKKQSHLFKCKDITSFLNDIKDNSTDCCIVF